MSRNEDYAFSSFPCLNGQYGFLGFFKALVKESNYMYNILMLKLKRVILLDKNLLQNV